MTDLFERFGKNAMPQGAQNPLSNIPATMQAFQEFRKNFSGNPIDAMMKITSSNVLTSEQYSEIKSYTDQLYKMITGR